MAFRSSLVIIEADRIERGYFLDVWRYRELLFFLAWRDFIVRYKQTVVGAAWAILRPLLAMVVFTFVFGYLGKFPSHGVPYPLLVYAAMLPWQLFANTLSEAGNSLVGNSSLITKVYFPRLIIPASTVLTSLVDLVVAGILLVPLMLWFDFAPDWRILTLPLFVLIAILAALGFGIWLSALNVKYRDFRYIVPFIVQLGLYVSPVGFSSSVVPEEWRLLYSLNPMVGVIDGFRWALLGSNFDFYLPGFLLSSALVIVVLATGILYFRKTERSFSDVI